MSVVYRYDIEDFLADPELLILRREVASLEGEKLRREKQVRDACEIASLRARREELRKELGYD